MYHLIEIEIVVGILSAEMFLVNVLRKISNKICLLNVFFFGLCILPRICGR